MKNHFVLFGLLLSLFTSCYVQHPRYATLDTVQTIDLGMSYEEVNVVMTMPPYDLIKKDTLGFVTYLYKYRVEDVKRIPIIMKKTKGISTEGGFRDLYLTFNSGQILCDIQSDYEGETTSIKKTKIDPNALINSITTVITVTIPAIMIYIFR